MQKTYTIGVTGGSGSGKTFFIKQLASHFSPEELCVVSQDNYYRPREHQQTDDNGIKNVDLPTSIDREQFHEDILRLKRGIAIEKAEYTFNNPDAIPRQLIFNPAPILVIEGLFVQYFPEIERELDLRVFIEARDHLKITRRIRRDYEERGYGLDDVLYRYQHHVMPVYETMIEPLKHQADLIVPNNRHFEHALRVLVLAIRQILSSQR